MVRKRRTPKPPPEQATQTPSREASSSRPSDIPTEHLEQLSPQTELAVVPASSKQRRLPRRPQTEPAVVPALRKHSKSRVGYFEVKANHFIAELSCNDFYHYDVSITPQVTSRELNRSVIKELVRLFKASKLGGRLPVYDGKKNLYTAGSLPFRSAKFPITFVDEDGAAGTEKRSRKFTVVIKLAARIDLHQLNMFLTGRQDDAPQEVLQILDIVLRELVISGKDTRFYPVGRSFYSPPPPELCEKNLLGDGLEIWRGFYQSIRPTQMGLSLNIDISTTTIIEAFPVVYFLSYLDIRNIHASRKLNDEEWAKVNKSLKGMKVEVTHRGETRRKYRIASLTLEETKDLSFSVDKEGTTKTVIQYFQERYHTLIEHPNLPCLQVGTQQRPIYLPMEVCRIVQGQRYSKKLKGEQLNNLLKETCKSPQVRETDIINTVNLNQYDSNQYAKEFGITFSKKLALVYARRLPTPQLQYGRTGVEQTCVPVMGEWNMDKKKMENGGTVKHWTCINFARKVDEWIIHEFCSKLASLCQDFGMVFASESVFPVKTAEPEQVERALKDVYKDAMMEHKALDLLIVILRGNNSSLYGDIKRICETEIGLVSQCCLFKNVVKVSPYTPYLTNVALKINVKAGGRNTVLADAMSGCLPLVSEKSTIIFGADVTHPHPGEDSSPSIAAVVASQDWPEITKYVGRVCAQAHRHELIQDLYGMIMDLLRSFEKAIGRSPERIIFYRDGVSEGQFNQVLHHEVESIRKAWASLYPDKVPVPPITFVVVQKRHHTRFFAKNLIENRTVNKSGNILPGTVVDSKICHPTEFDFYLCSHSGIQGTSRPAHYHVLCDENNFSADDLQTLTYKLCYTYARCTRSVSIVPPAYYAHLLASRARFYMGPMTSENASQPRAAAANETHNTHVDGGGAVRPLPAIKDNVKSVMFYC